MTKVLDICSLQWIQATAYLKLTHFIETGGKKKGGIPGVSGFYREYFCNPLIIEILRALSQLQ